MKTKNWITMVGLTCIAMPLYAQDAGLDKFFQHLYVENRDAIAHTYEAELQDFLHEYNLDATHQGNHDAFLKLHFYHDLFTTSNAEDGRRDGVLSIPYFWHWTTPNPRHRIKHLPTNRPLTEISPPQRFARYQTFADIDRTPSLYLADLVSEEPHYYHPAADSFYTFGWCSEREMAFSLLLSLDGFDGRVLAAGPHAWSEFRVSFMDAAGRRIFLIASVDNTFDDLFWSSTPQTTMEEWLSKYGAERLTRWYNAMAQSPSEREHVRNTVITSRAQIRIRSLVRAFLSGNR